MNERVAPAGFDLDMTDRLFTTTRAVRKRLDLERDVSDATILECIDLAEQAPSGGNDIRQRPIDDGTVRVADGPGVVTDIDIAAKPVDVCAVVSDINMPAAFSDEFLGADWTTGTLPASRRNVPGRNEVPGKFTWEVNCIVTAWNQHEAFEWRITDADDPGAIWRFDLGEQGTGSRLRMSMIIGQRNNGTAPAARKAAQENPGNVQKELNGRRETLKANMQRTIEGEKLRAETNANGINAEVTP